MVEIAPSTFTDGSSILLCRTVVINMTIAERIKLYLECDVGMSYCDDCLLQHSAQIEHLCLIQRVSSSEALEYAVSAGKKRQ